MDIGEHWVALIFVGIIALLGFAGAGDELEAQQAEVHYCKMVKLYKSTNGEYGWPDYEEKISTCDVQDD